MAAMLNQPIYKISPYLQLTTPRLLLTALKQVTPEAILEYHSENQTFWKQWSPIPHPDFYTLDYHKSKFKQEAVQLLNITALRLYLLPLHQPNQIIGDVHFSSIVFGAFQSCYLGYKIHHQFSNQGLITEALQTAIPYVFSTLKLHRIEANIMPRNISSIKVAEKLGFQNEGISQKYLQINGTWEDHCRYVLFNSNS